MLKYVMLASAMTMSVPALAQTAPMPAQTTPTQQMPTTSMDDSATTAPQTTPAPMDPAAGTPSTTTAQTPTAQPAPQGVESVVEAEFASYDKDSNGQLSMTEFASWMDALKAKSADKAARDPKWNAKAFAQADADKSKSVTKVELTGFLSGAPASAS